MWAADIFLSAAAASTASVSSADGVQSFSQLLDLHSEVPQHPAQAWKLINSGVSECLCIFRNNFYKWPLYLWILSQVKLACG